MRKSILVILCLTALLLLGYSGYGSYEIWKQKHLMSMARQFAAESDLNSARLSLTELLRVNPQNIEASRLMAEYSDPNRSSAILIWRKRVVALDPESANDRIALAEIAVKMHDLATADEALKGIPETDRGTAHYHIAAGGLDAAGNQLAPAEAHFLEAIRLEPQSAGAELSLAVLCLHDTNGPAMVEARKTLARLSTNPTNSNVRTQAIRELTMDAIQHHQIDASLSFSAQLVHETNTLFTDRLLRLEAERMTQNEGFKTELVSVRQEAQSDTGKIQELVMWQLAKLPPADSLAWLRSLTTAMQTNRTVAQLEAECLVALQDWPGLQACVNTGNWGETEFVRHAFSARARREHGPVEAANAEWSQAMKTADGQEANLVVLLRLATQWGWLREGEEILRAIVEAHPNEAWARQALAQSLFASGQTQGLLQLFSQQLTRDPSDLVAKNTVTITALLLDAQEFKPDQAALELYQESPTNSSFAATYAFSLYLHGKKTDALKVLDRLDAQQLETAAVAPCYGLVLKALGDRVKAKKYLDLASKFAMLPEERKFIDAARNDLDQAIIPKS